MRRTITTKADLRNWVDEQTSGWPNRDDTDVDAITDEIQVRDHPAWGADWTEYLENLPDLENFLDT